MKSHTSDEFKTGHKTRWRRLVVLSSRSPLRRGLASVAFSRIRLREARSMKRNSFDNFQGTPLLDAASHNNEIVIAP